MTTLLASLVNLCAALFVGSLLFVAAITAGEYLRPRPTLTADRPAPTDEGDYSWSATPTYDSLLAERFRVELEATDAATRIGDAL